MAGGPKQQKPHIFRLSIFIALYLNLKLTFRGWELNIIQILSQWAGLKIQPFCASIMNQTKNQMIILLYVQ